MNVVPTTSTTSPITAAELRAYLRLNDQGEDTLLTEFLLAAAERFEDDTRRPVLSRTYKQYLNEWPEDLRIILGRGGISAVASVKKRLANDTVSSVAYQADILTAPNNVRITEIPALEYDGNGIDLSPVGYVEYSAGWANAAAVPKSVNVALKSLAGFWYENREAYAEGSLGSIAQGWERVIAQYRLGLSETWQ